jgi:hypothetical protein
MPTINKANGLLAEFAIFPVEPISQKSLVECSIQNIESGKQDCFQPMLTAVLTDGAASILGIGIRWQNSQPWIPIVRSLPCLAKCSN